MTTFDTLAATRELENVGFERRQAETIAQNIRGGQGELATKTDIGWNKAYLGFIAALSFATLGLTAAHVFGGA